MAEIKFTNEPEMENPTLKDEVEKENELKSFIVDYVGEKQNPEDDKVTMEMVIDVMTDEFPEFLLTLAEENWVRGYHQALADVDLGEQIVNDGEVEEDVNERKS